MSDLDQSGQPGLHVVLGAAGGTGSALVSELGRRGLPARAVSRATITAAARNRGGHRGPLRPGGGARSGGRCEVVYHAANPPYPRWMAEFPNLNATIADATAAVGAKLVLADNLYMYGPSDGRCGRPRPNARPTRRAQLRIRLAADLLEAHAAGRLRVTLGRSPDYFGPGGRGSAIGEQLFAAAIAGKRARWLGSTDVPHSVAYLPDMAAGARHPGYAR